MPHALPRTVPHGWAAIFRLGLVQAAIGSVVVLATSTMNRVMVVELALPAILPGLLVGLHYAVQLARTRVGHGSDVGGRLSYWTAGGMLILALGGIGAAGSIGLMAAHSVAGMLAAVVSYALVGLGVGACGTSLLVLLARTAGPERRAAAATLTWLMMLVGFAVTTAVVGQLLDPYSPARLIEITAGICGVDLLITVLAIRNVDKVSAGGTALGRRAPDANARSADAADAGPAGNAFSQALRQVWREPVARRFTMFIFLSMLAFSGQELILEPFAGRVFQLSPAHTARLASALHAGALVGMLLVAALGSLPRRWRVNSLPGWTAGGCIASGAALAGLIVAAATNAAWPLNANILLLGLANGVFTIGAIGSMMSLVAVGGAGHQGLRMGLWGAAQAIAFAVGGAISSAGVDIAGKLSGSPATAYSCVFAAQAVLFCAAAALAARIGVRGESPGKLQNRQSLGPRGQSIQKA